MMEKVFKITFDALLVLGFCAALGVPLNLIGFAATGDWVFSGARLFMGIVGVGSLAALHRVTYELLNKLGYVGQTRE